MGRYWGCPTPSKLNGFLDPLAFQTSGADFHSLNRGSHRRVDGVEIGLPDLLCFVVRVTDIKPDLATFSTYITYTGHGKTPLASQRPLH